LPKVMITMPAYNAAATLETTYKHLAKQYQKNVLVCDDASSDDTAKISKKLGLVTILHSKNKGYGANQKSLYDEAIKQNAEVVIMVHPDNQYDTSCLPEMMNHLKNGADMVLATRMKTARSNNMPWWKYWSNRFLTIIQNKIYKQKISEYHTGLRAYNARLLKSMPFEAFSDDFVFDSETIAWTIANNYQIKEVDTHCRYTTEASSINFRRSLLYGLSTLLVLLRFKLGRYVMRKST